MVSFLRRNLDKFWLAVLLTFAVISCGVLFFSLLDKAGQDNHLIFLARRFLSGNLDLGQFNLPNGDIVVFGHRRFLYFGPLISFILIPFILIYDADWWQTLIGPACLVLILILSYLLARRFLFSKTNSLWLALFLGFSSVIFPLSTVAISAYQVQLVGAVFVLGSLCEYYGRRRIFLIGLLIALAGLTRMTLFLSTVFFLLVFLKDKIKLSKLALFSLPIIFSLLLLAGYNHKRFHAFWETGYKYNLTLKTYPMEINYKYGLFNIRHLPTNLYLFLFKGPDILLEQGGGYIAKFPYLKIDPWGLAIWYTSPLVVLLLIFFKKNYISLASIFTSFLLLVPSLLYFGLGYSQVGYRYSLDFLPFVFITLLLALKNKLPMSAKFLITSGIVFLGLYSGSPWDSYPVFDILGIGY